MMRSGAVMGQVTAPMMPSVVSRVLCLIYPPRPRFGPGAGSFDHQAFDPGRSVVYLGLGHIRPAGGVRRREAGE